MITTIHRAPKMPRGHVLIFADGVVVANGEMVEHLVAHAQAEREAERIDIYLHPVDAEDFMVWRAEQMKRRRLH